MITIDETNADQRLDKIHTELELKSRHRLQQLIVEGLVLVNGEPQKTVKKKIRIGDTVEVLVNEVKKQPVDLPILYEDDEIIVINKPSGVLMHSKGNNDSEFTVADFSRERTTDDEKGREGIVHRLDRDTSGVVIIAKTKDAKMTLQAQFANRFIVKKYIARAEGVIKEQKAVFEWPIERHPKRPFSFRVGIGGKSARTTMEVESIDKATTVVTLTPKTGRTHQLRVHMAHYGHPVLGDPLYGTKPAERMFLHACSITFTNMKDEEVTVTSEPSWIKEIKNG